MLSRPDDLSDQQIVDALNAWGLSVAEIAYVPLGFGSHHWQVTADGQRWFVNVDDVESKRRVSESDDEPLRRLEAALSTAWSLRGAGLQFVVAPVRTPTGTIVEMVNRRFAAAVYPHVDGESRSWGPYRSRAERLSVLELIAELHQSTDVASPTALTDDLGIDSRNHLDVALDELDTPWTGGPYAEPARALLRPRADLVTRALGHYDELAASVIEQRGRMVVTHGEPHRGNTMATPSGVMLIDWDTAQIAPPERDLWSLVAEDPSIAADYTAMTGTVTNPESMELYRLRWTLTDIALFIADFRRDHPDNEDTRTAISGLRNYLDPAQWPV